MSYIIIYTIVRYSLRNIIKEAYKNGRRTRKKDFKMCILRTL